MGKEINAILGAQTILICRYMYLLLHSYIPWYFSGFQELLGIIVGHLYFFLMFKYPQDFGGISLLHTPQFL